MLGCLSHKQIDCSKDYLLIVPQYPLYSFPIIKKKKVQFWQRIQLSLTKNIMLSEINQTERQKKWHDLTCGILKSQIHRNKE